MNTNTEKAIEFLKDCQDDYEELQEEGNNKGILEVIRLLLRGERFEQMWGELYNKYSDKELSYILDEIKQKCFPKEVIK